MFHQRWIGYRSVNQIFFWPMQKFTRPYLSVHKCTSERGGDWRVHKCLGKRIREWAFLVTCRPSINRILLTLDKALPQYDSWSRHLMPIPMRSRHTYHRRCISLSVSTQTDGSQRLIWTAWCRNGNEGYLFLYLDAYAITRDKYWRP